jgi:hypothetical protein
VKEVGEVFVVFEVGEVWFKRFKQKTLPTIKLLNIKPA